ncbi:response regulator transcription factor [Leucobacter sp. wl10]|uniref:response regulator transcription factor n=1 Tax=Leucobacter sp. wl10 TaxID=2304677 RepID=UPI000E5BCD0F|nr:response regulator transcription factor [Leucobacter sp. wl10]RGE24271.1 DNA-binding response regulator [Leucobacter sp. wl10]
MSRILIVEDEERIATFVGKGLRAAGHAVDITGSGEDALAALQASDFDLVILDVGLPGMNGFEVLEVLRGTGDGVAVIMLTAQGSLEDTVRGLDGGADDYLVKPFRFEELLARVRARLRDSARPQETATPSFGGVSLDVRTRRARVDGREVDLSAREYALAEEFLRHPDQVLSREQLLNSVWGYGFDPGSNIVDVYVRYLRGKLGEERIETVRGVGYRLAG